MGPDLQVQVYMELTGEASINVWSVKGTPDLAAVLPGALHCRRVVNPSRSEPNAFRCPQALRRDGLVLEGVVDLASIAPKLDGATGIRLWVNAPRLGFNSSSLAMEDHGGGGRASLTAHFAPGVTPQPVVIRFGYRRDQLAAVYLPLLAFALVLTLIVTLLARSGLAGLARSAILLGAILWMAAAAQLQAGDPLRILLYGDPLAHLAALFVQFWPPLLCTAFGVAL